MLVLASTSPRRRDLLTWTGIPFRVEASPAIEISAKEGLHLTPGELAAANARRKGAAVAALFPNDTVLAADTIVSLGNTVFGKPANLKEAAAFLAQLSGQTHEVITAVTLFRRGRLAAVQPVYTKVTFRSLSPAAIRRYLRDVPVLDKAGAYAVQEKGPALISKIDGSLSNVMGLPVEETMRLLRGADLSPSL